MGSDTLLTPRPTENLREKIKGLEKALSQIPGVVIGDSDKLPLKHAFAEGTYVREIFIPKGTALTGKIHRHSHPNFLMKGEVIVVTEHGGREHLKAPLSMISKAGTQRAIYALEDTVWVTVHATNETDLKKIEAYVIAPTFEDLLPSGGKPQLGSELAEKNCLIRALRELGRDYNCLLELEADGIWLPFKKAIETLDHHGISMDGLSATMQGEGVWHVMAGTEAPIDPQIIQESDKVGTWVGVAYVVYDQATKGPGQTQAPPASGSEDELRQLQIDALKKQASNQDLLYPQQVADAGYQPIYGENPEMAVYRELSRKIDIANAAHGGDNNNPDSMALRIEYTKHGFDSDGDWSKPIITGYEKTDTRKSQDTQLATLQGLQLDTATKSNKLFNDYLDSQNTPEAKAAQAKQAQINAQQQDIALQQGDRQKLALEGKLPVSQGTTDRKMQEFASLKETLARSGNHIIGDDPGTAYSLSSPGSQALDLFNRRYGAIESQERQGTLDSSAQTYLQSVGLSGDIGNKTLSNSAGGSGVGGYASTSSSILKNTPYQNNMSLVQGYATAMQPYQLDRQNALQNSQYNAGIAAQDRAGWLNLVGTGVGVGAGAMMSSRKSKKKITAQGKDHEEEAMKSLSKTPVYKWNYKHEADGAKPHIGTMTEEAPPEIVSHDGKHIDVASYFGVLTHGIKNIDKRLALLEGK